MFMTPNEVKLEDESTLFLVRLARVYVFMLSSRVSCPYVRQTTNVYCIAQDQQSGAEGQLGLDAMLRQVASASLCLFSIIHFDQPNQSVPEELFTIAMSLQ